MTTGNASAATSFRLKRAVIFVLLAFQLSGTVMEVLSLAILLPVFQYVQAMGNVEALAAQHREWRILVSVYSSLGLSLSLITLLFTSFVFLMLRQGLVYARLRYQAWAKETLVADVRAVGFRHYLSADTAYQDREEAGTIVNDLTVDLQRGADYVFAGIMLAGLLTVFAVYLVGLFTLSVPVTLTALVVFGVAVGALRGPMGKSETVGAEVVQANRRMSSFLVERLKLAKLVRLAGTEVAENEQMGKLTLRQRNSLVRLFALLAKIEIVMEPIVIGAGFLFIYISVTVFGMRMEQIGLFLVMLLRLLPVVKEATRTRQSTRASRPAYNAVVRRMRESEAAREQDHGSLPFSGLGDCVRFEDVRFAYDNNPKLPALNGITLSIPANKMVALVGPSGAGKSTLVDMLPRLRRPQSGRILFDGVDLEEFSLKSLRAGIAYAPQTPQIFNVSLADHIRYGKSDATVEEVQRAARLAGAHTFIQSMPQGYETIAGDGGGRLSGGQRQRLDLARALVRQAPILVLDEPTSNLDAESEALFRDAIRRIRRETRTTIIIIGHRLSTVIAADMIVVMQAGKIAETDAHAALVTAGGWYQRAFAKQHGGITTARGKSAAAE